MSASAVAGVPVSPCPCDLCVGQGWLAQARAGGTSASDAGDGTMQVWLLS